MADPAGTAERVSYLDAPEGWLRRDARGFGRFVTREVFTGPDGRELEWTSREHRKQAGPLDAGRGSTWWAPSALGWWIGVLFAIGAACFAVGPFPGYVDAVGPRADAITFFVGSIFFTTAAFLQYVQAVNAPRDLVMPLRKQKLKIFVWEPGRIDWEATAIQFVGTVFFNITTLAAIDTAWSTQQATRLVWVPDAAGSVCFLVASWFAWGEVVARLVGVGAAPPRLVDRRAQHARVDRVRRVGPRRVLRADHRRHAQHAPREPRHRDRRCLLPRGRAAAPPRAHRAPRPEPQRPTRHPDRTIAAGVSP